MWAPEHFDMHFDFMSNTGEMAHLEGDRGRVEHWWRRIEYGRLLVEDSWFLIEDLGLRKDVHVRARHSIDGDVELKTRNSLRITTILGYESDSRSLSHWSEAREQSEMRRVVSFQAFPCT